MPTPTAVTLAVPDDAPAAADRADPTPVTVAEPLDAPLA
jgi:hypothetical protein